MKKISLILVVLTFCTAFYSCGKKDNTTTPTPTPTPTPTNNNTGTAALSAKINGGQYTAGTITHFLYQGEYQFSSLQNSGSKTLGFDVANLAAGTYPFSGNTTTVVYSPDGGTTPYTSGFGNTGTIIITANNGSAISGTFTCHLYNIYNTADSVVITNGVFNYIPFK